MWRAVVVIALTHFTIGSSSNASKMEGSNGSLRLWIDAKQVKELSGTYSMLL